MAGGYYVFEAENLDEALELARADPRRASTAAVEVWPMVDHGAAEPPGGQQLARAAARAAGDVP